MRFIYLDEAGISNPAQEPYVVVAGAIVHADTQCHQVIQDRPTVLLRERFAR
jgi:hypothetical protein